MTDPESDEWIKIRGKQPIGQICKFGPSVPVEISSLDNSTIEKAIALIDTGASHSCITPQLFERLRLTQIGTANLHTPGREPNHVPICRARLHLPGGTQLEGNFTVSTGLVKPISLLIGRDILQRCRLAIDFTKGSVELDIREGGAGTP